MEAQELVVGYKFDLRTNHLSAQTVSNPNAGSIHQFRAYRLTSQTSRPVTMVVK